MITKVGFSQVGTQNQNRKIQNAGLPKQNMQSEPSFGMVLTYGKMDFMQALKRTLLEVLGDAYQVRFHNDAFSSKMGVADNVIDGKNFNDFSWKKDNFQRKKLLGDAYRRVTQNGENFSEANILVINKKEFVPKPAVLVNGKETSEQLISRILDENSPITGDSRAFVQAKILEMPEGDKILATILQEHKPLKDEQLFAVVDEEERKISTILNTEVRKFNDAPTATEPNWKEIAEGIAAKIAALRVNS